jgi:hypothetical protein
MPGINRASELNGKQRHIPGKMLPAGPDQREHHQRCDGGLRVDPHRPGSIECEKWRATAGVSVLPVRLATQYPLRKKNPHTEIPSSGVYNGDLAKDAKCDQTTRAASNRRRAPGGKISAGMFILTLLDRLC